MTYDLRFYHNVASKVGEMEFVDYFLQISQCKIEFLPDGFIVDYDNEETGVYFYLSYVRQNADDLCRDILFDSGLSFEVNYGRPVIFAFESMQFVSDLANHFDLLIENYQDLSSCPPLPKKYTVQELIETWGPFNEMVNRLVESKRNKEQEDGR